MSGVALGQLVRDQAGALAERPALEFGARVTSFSALEHESDAAAAALMRGGALPGDRVAYLGRNSDRYFILLVAAAKAGLVMVPIGWRLAADEVRYLLRDSTARVLFVEPAFVRVARAVADSTVLISTEEAWDGLRSYGAWLDGSAAAAVTLPQVDPSSAVLQLYTSGTTGRPKGAMIAHEAIFPLRSLSAAAGLDWDAWDANDVSLLTMPVAHIAGTGWGLIGIYSGARTIVLPEFDPAQIIRLLSTEAISRVFLVPTAIGLLLRHPDVRSGDYSRLRYILYGASPMPLPVLREAIAVFGCGFVQNYGMTETCGSVVVLGPEDHEATGNERMSAAGRPLPGVLLRVVDESMVDCATGQVGEVLVCSPTNMIGYWNLPEATAAALSDGWMRTGDAGFLDADGYLFIRDRLKDMIISGGENVFPVEVEAVLRDHPDVADVAVIGVPDPQWGEAVTAIVVPRTEAADGYAILAWAKGRMASYKIPKRIYLRDSLPCNANGKVLKRELRKPFWDAVDRAVN